MLDKNQTPDFPEMDLDALADAMESLGKVAGELAEQITESLEDNADDSPSGPKVPAFKPIRQNKRLRYRPNPRALGRTLYHRRHGKDNRE